MRVNWKEGYANTPEFEVLTDKIPNKDTLRFEQKGRLWFAESGGYCSFYSHSGADINEGGFYRDPVKINLKDGSNKVLKGPWSSRAGVMNREGFGPCLDLAVTDDPGAFERGHTFTAGSIALDLIIDAMRKFLPDVHLLKVVDETDVDYYPSVSTTEVKKPSGFVCKLYGVKKLSVEV